MPAVRRLNPETTPESRPTYLLPTSTTIAAYCRDLYSATLLQVRVRRWVVRSGVLAPVQRLRREPAQLLGRVDVRARGCGIRVRLSGRSGRQTLWPGRAAVRRPVPGQAVVPVRVRGCGSQHAAVQRRARDQTVRRTRHRVLRQTRRST